MKNIIVFHIDDTWLLICYILQDVNQHTFNGLLVHLLLFWGFIINVNTCNLMRKDEIRYIINLLLIFCRSVESTSQYPKLLLIFY